MQKNLNSREKVAIIILLFIVKLVNPTGYNHEVTELKKTIEEQL